MGWQGNAREITLGMLFKKMYCRKCGTKLVRKASKRIVNKGDDEFERCVHIYRRSRLLPICMSSCTLTTYTYLCSQCGVETTYEEQCQIAKKQRQLKRRILDENE